MTTVIPLTDFPHITHDIIYRKSMLNIIEILDEIQSLVLRKIIVCKGIADKVPISECTYARHIK